MLGPAETGMLEPWRLVVYGMWCMLVCGIMVPWYVIYVVCGMYNIVVIWYMVCGMWYMNLYEYMV
jgi:hypothetical protein